MDDKKQKDNKQSSKDISPKKKGKGLSSIIKGFEELTTIDESESHISKTSPNSSTNKQKDASSVDFSEYPEISLTNKLSEHDTINYLKSRKDRIIKYSALIISVLLILIGITLISTSAVKVSDNVIFGERAMLSAFFILIGIMGIAAIYARKLLSKTFFRKMNLDLEIVDEEKEVVSDDKKYKKEDNNNINAENKIGKEDKNV